MTTNTNNQEIIYSLLSDVKGLTSQHKFIESKISEVNLKLNDISKILSTNDRLQYNVENTNNELKSIISTINKLVNDYTLATSKIETIWDTQKHQTAVNQALRKKIEDLKLTINTINNTLTTIETSIAKIEADKENMVETQKHTQEFVKNVLFLGKVTVTLLGLGVSIVSIVSYFK